jgi:hypothetical protein
VNKRIARTIIKAYSVLSWIIGFLSILFGFFIILFYIKFMETSTKTIISSIILIIIGVLACLIGNGLWRFSNWARVSGIILFCICFLASLLTLIFVIGLSTATNGLQQIIIPFGLIACPIIGLIIPGLFIYFFIFNKAVTGIFKHPNRK